MSALTLAADSVAALVRGLGLGYLGTPSPSA
jgi:hypothetical protein